MKTLSRREWIAASIAIIVTTILFFGGDIWSVVVGVPETTAPTSLGVPDQKIPMPEKMKNISTVPGIEIYDLQVGTGAEAVKGKTVSAHYVGVLTDGTKFDSSIDRNKPFEFVLGTGQVIKGWDIGIEGMKVDGIRQLVISPELGYGPQAIGPIPANSTLVFQVQLLEVK
jgi:FKBP-type peptidyl-prolyl cis-trans isomerase